MEIKLTEEEGNLIITNEGFDNNNYVTLIMGEKEICCSIDELYSAVHSFIVLKIQQNNNNKNYK